MKFVGHQGPEISFDGEGDPIRKPSNTTETGVGVRWQRITCSFFELETPDFTWKFV